MIAHLTLLIGVSAALAAPPPAPARREESQRVARPASPSARAALKADFQPTVRWNGSREATLRRFEALNQKVSRALCRQGADHRYGRLLQNYRGNGFYLPELPDGSPDLHTVRGGLPDVRSKIKWIQGLIDDLKTRRDFPNEQEQTARILRLVNRSLELKKRLRMARSQRDTREARKESRATLGELRKAWNELVSRVPFLLSFGFPVDHRAAREEFEKVKEARGGSSMSSRRRANELFFERRLREDGAFDPATRGGYDMYLRTTLDTLTLRLRADEDALQEDIRYDLEWAVDAIRSTLSRGRFVHASRLQAWKEKAEGSLEFYENLLALPEDQIPPQTRERARHVKNLRDFVQRKHAEAYRLLSGEPEMMQAMWVIEKILFNEVGDLDREFGLEKRDVAQVVINRSSHPKYSRIPPSDDLYPYLVEELKGDKATSPWLNTLFRGGEFSFTYYYIPAVANVFCPDRSKRGREIQRENARIAFDMLRRPNPEFSALRYFSRRSMTGKIDMSTSWPEYVPIPERAGVAVRAPGKLAKRLESGDYRYLYDFVDPEGSRYDVIQLGAETYAVRGFPSDPVFHHYRDPHSFRYYRRFRDSRDRAPAALAIPEL
ncbi:MAG: hypothetical protein IT285_08110 [Bdellovibrionales bacterium]|nr:hypothetical protein [Bdellovibrionales bacterium]